MDGPGGRPDHHLDPKEERRGGIVNTFHKALTPKNFLWAGAGRTGVGGTTGPRQTGGECNFLREGEQFKRKGKGELRLAG